VISEPIRDPTEKERMLIFEWEGGERKRSVPEGLLVKGERWLRGSS